jgi:hypothetical protein
MLADHAEQVLTVGQHLIPTLLTSSDSWIPVVHGDLHAANIFVCPERVSIIDPVFSEPRARLAPHFTELAPLYADVRVQHRLDLAKRIETDFRTTAVLEQWSLFLLWTCLKILVRYRISSNSLTRAADSDHRSSGPWWSDPAMTAGLLDTVLAELADDAAAGSRSP